MKKGKKKNCKHTCCQQVNKRKRTKKKPHLTCHLDSNDGGGHIVWGKKGGGGGCKRVNGGYSCKGVKVVVAIKEQKNKTTCLGV